MLLATFVVAVERAAAERKPDGEKGPYTDQTVDGDPECTVGVFPGDRTLIGRSRPRRSSHRVANSRPSPYV